MLKVKFGATWQLFEKFMKVLGMLRKMFRGSPEASSEPSQISDMERFPKIAAISIFAKSRSMLDVWHDSELNVVITFKVLQKDLCNIFQGILKWCKNLLWRKYVWEIGIDKLRTGLLVWKQLPWQFRECSGNWALFSLVILYEIFPHKDCRQIFFFRF